MWTGLNWKKRSDRDREKCVNGNCIAIAINFYCNCLNNRMKENKNENAVEMKFNGILKSNFEGKKLEFTC